MKRNDKNNGSYTEKYYNHFPCSFAYKVVCIDNKFSKRVVIYRGKNAVYRFIEAILEEYDYFKKIIKKHFNENLIMPAEKYERFQLSNNCWICDKLFNVGGDEVRYHCHTSGKYRAVARWSCNSKWTKKISIIFHNLRGYRSHLIRK